MQAAVEGESDPRFAGSDPKTELTPAAEVTPKPEKRNLTWAQLTKSLCAGGIAGAV